MDAQLEYVAITAMVLLLLWYGLWCEHRTTPSDRDDRWVERGAAVIRCALGK